MKKVRAHCFDMLRSRLKAGVTAGDLPRGTHVDRLARFYLGVYEGMAIQAHDGASAAELKGFAELAMAAWPDEKRTPTRR